MTKKTKKPDAEPADITIDKSEMLARSDDAPIGIAPNCPVCGGSRDGMAPSEPCKVDGYQLEDSP